MQAMIKLKTIYIISFMFLLLTIITNDVYSDDITQSEDIRQSEANSQFEVLPNITDDTYSEDNNQINIRFANTISVGYFSNNLYRDDIRSKHNTILDKPAFNFDEKFQIIIRGNTDNEIETTEIGCLSIPNSGYGSINLLYSHYENFAIRTGLGFEAGFGDYRNPFISAGMSFIYLHDMVFNKGNSNGRIDKDDGFDMSSFINIGYKDDIHLFIDFSWALFGYPGYLLARTYNYSLELVLGYKELIPVFLKIKGFTLINEDNKINYTDGIQYSYEQLFSLIHIQYYGDSFGLSIGYSSHIELYRKMILDDKQTGYIDDDITVDKRSYNGGGITFDLKNADYTFEFFGELHILADKDYNWLTICKFGTTVYF